MFNDIASEMILTLLPLYMRAALKAPHIAIGLIEGISIFASSLCKLLSGCLADMFYKHVRLLIALGYLVSALARPAMYLADTYLFIAAMKLVDKAGKAIRGPGRDLLLSQSLRQGQRAFAYGMHHLFETGGGVISMALALIVISVGGTGELSHAGYSAIVLLSLPFGLASVLCAACLTTEPPATLTPPHLRPVRYLLGAPAIDEPSLLERVTRSPLAVLVALLFLIQCFSPPAAFVPLLAVEVGGMSLPSVALLLFLHQLVYALSIAPAALLADRLENQFQHGRAFVLAAALVLRAGLMYALSEADSGLSLGITWVLWGAYLGLTESLTKVRKEFFLHSLI
jgi:hypothetical protein